MNRGMLPSICFGGANYEYPQAFPVLPTDILPHPIDIICLFGDGGAFHQMGVASNRTV
jgi:hypothetical protein